MHLDESGTGKLLCDGQGAGRGAIGAARCEYVLLSPPLINQPKCPFKEDKSAIVHPMNDNSYVGFPSFIEKSYLTR